MKLSPISPELRKQLEPEARVMELFEIHIKNVVLKENGIPKSARRSLTRKIIASSQAMDFSKKIDAMIDDYLKNKMNTSHKSAKRIMGRNYLSVDRAIQEGYEIDQKQIKKVLSDPVPFHNETLRAHCYTHLLVPTSPMSLVKIPDRKV